MCQYNNIYTSLHKYLKEKKNTNRLLKKKKTLGTVTTVPIESTKRWCSYCALAYSHFLYIEIWFIKPKTHITVQKSQNGWA